MSSERKTKMSCETSIPQTLNIAVQLVEAIDVALDRAACRKMVFYAWVEFDLACVHEKQPAGIQCVKVFDDGNFEMIAGRQPR